MNGETLIGYDKNVDSGEGVKASTNGKLFTFLKTNAKFTEHMFIPGGALAIGVCDRLNMLQYATYAVISPEGCASILWKTAEKAPDAAEAKLDRNAIIAGTRIAIAEMLASGTTSFSDMYFYEPDAARLVSETGIRASLSN